MKAFRRMTFVALSLVSFASLSSEQGANPATVQYVDQQDAKLKAQLAPGLFRHAGTDQPEGANPASVDYVDAQDAIIQTLIDDSSSGTQYMIGQPLCTTTPTVSCSGAADQWGVVVYVDPNPALSGYAAVAMAISDANSATSWGASQAASNQVGANAYGIYGGIHNAQAYATYCSTNNCSGDSVFHACSAFAAGGFTDWYTPSIGEVNLMLRISEQFSYGADGAMNLLSTFSNVRYWGSTENSGYGALCGSCGTGPASSALMMNITSGSQFWYPKTNTTHAVRCMRPLPA